MKKFETPVVEVLEIATENVTTLGTGSSIGEVEELD